MTQEFDNSNRISLFQSETENQLEGHIAFDDPKEKWPVRVAFVEDGAHIVRVWKPGAVITKHKPTLTGTMTRLSGGIGESGKPRPTHRVCFDGKRERRTYALWTYNECITGQLETRAALPVSPRW